MGDYLTSSEFASLRNVNLNSLRYYEKLGLLRPAYTDPKTKYRYFRLEQLCTLDTILFFIEVGIPLKKLTDYVDGKGSLDHSRILRDAKKEMEEKITAMRSMLATTEYDLAQLEQNRWCNTLNSVFTREIEARSFMVKPFSGDWNDPAQREKEAMEIFRQGKIDGMLPTFPAGILLEFDGDRVAYSFFVQVLRPAKCELPIIRVGRGTFRCLQIELTPQLDLPAIVEKHFGRHIAHPVILNHIIRDTHHLTQRYIEIQIAQDSQE